MNFDKTVNWTAKIYKLLEKINHEEIFPIDTLVDTAFPEISAKLQTYSKLGKIAICSTNGKKTTANILNQILETNNNSFITNITKKAKKYPILASVIMDLADNKTEEKAKDYYTMIMDEFEIAGYFNTINFNYLLLGNIFRDQKDFYTIENKRKKIQDALILNSECKLIINADEPMLYRIDEKDRELITSQKMNKVFYGFNSIEVQDNENFIQKNDILRCPICSCKLDYKKRFYSHIGQYDCACGFRRPELDISADAKIFNDYSFLTVHYKNNKFVFKVPLGGVYNAYNALGAIAVALTIGIERKVITEALENLEYLRARDEIYYYHGKEIKIKEIKNPVSLTESIRELYSNKNTKAVFALNDTPLDGEDVGWIWDSNFNSLRGFENRIYVCSNRNEDMALKIKYAGVNPTLIIMDVSLKNAIKCCFYELGEDDKMIIFATPSLINDIYRILEK